MVNEMQEICTEGENSIAKQLERIGIMPIEDAEKPENLAIAKIITQRAFDAYTAKYGRPSSRRFQHH